MKYRAINVWSYDTTSDCVGRLGRTKQLRTKDEPMGPIKLSRLVIQSLSTFSVSSTEHFPKTD